MSERLDSNGGPEIVALGPQAIEDLVGKVANVAEQSHTQSELADWRAKHGREHATANARSYAVVGETLMFLHTCSDGVIVPIATYPDGRIKIYTDPAHAEEIFNPREGTWC